MRAYKINEMFASVQGEGYWTGRRAVFCRFSGCNLWSGREEDRASAVCRFCDTEFRGGGKLTAAEICEAAARLWGKGREGRIIVLTGGEPTLQADHQLVAALQRFDFTVAIETNGTRAVPAVVDWITVSPKAGAPLAQASGDEIKVVVPQDGLDLASLASLDFAHRFVQPMAGREGSEAAALAIVEADPRWRLSLQTHKYIGVR